MGQRGRGFGLGGAGLNFGFGGAASNSTDHRPTDNNENTMSNGRANNDEGTGTGLMAFGRGRGALRGHGGRGGHRNGDESNASANEPEQPRQNFGSAATSAERGRGGRAMLHIHGHGRGCGLPFERGGLQSGASISAPKDHGPRGNLDHADDEPPTIGLATASGRGRGRATRGPPGAFGTFGRGGAQIGSNAAGSGNQQKQHGDNNQSDNNNNRDDNNQQEPPEFDRRRIPESRCYMPPEKTSLELFDENVHIQKGPLFDDQFGPWHDNEIIVTCNGRVIEQSHRHTGTFRAFGLSQEIMNSVHIRKYVTPTQIQRAVIPLIMGHGEDIMGNAQTGSGKTAAFLLPIVNNLQTIVRQETSDNHLLRRIRAINRNAPKCIILVPAKELAEQIYEEARIFAEKTNVSVARSYGDMPMYRSKQSIQSGCDILVLTSGRLKHHLRDRHINLANLRYFVLDEADKLIEEKHFYDAVELTIEEAALTQNSPRHDPHAVCCRVMLFSATFNHHVQELAQAMLRDGYFFVRIGEMNRAVEIINQTFIEVEPSRKQEQLLDILCAGAVELPSQDGRVPYLLPAKKTIVFVEQKAFAALLTATLASRGFRVAHITSDCSLLRRLKVREHFLRGTVQLVVATNLLARGMNFPNVEHVINYDLPNYEPEAFIHRVGRTGRAGNLGRATSFFDTRSERDRANAAYYAKVLRTAKQSVPGFLLLCAGQAFDDLPEDVQGTSDGLQSGWNQSDDNWAHRNRNMGNAASSSHRPPTTVDNGGVRGNNMSSSTPDGIDNTIGQEKVVIRDTTEFEVVLSSEEHNGLTDTETAAPGDDHIGLTDEEDAENEENFIAPDAADCASRFEEIREEFFGNTGPPLVSLLSSSSL